MNTYCARRDGWACVSYAFSRAVAAVDHHHADANWSSQPSQEQEKWHRDCQDGATEHETIEAWNMTEYINYPPHALQPFKRNPFASFPLLPYFSFLFIPYTPSTHWFPTMIRTGISTFAKRSYSTVKPVISAAKVLPFHSSWKHPWTDLYSRLLFLSFVHGAHSCSDGPNRDISSFCFRH